MQGLFTMEEYRVTEHPRLGSNVFFIVPERYRTRIYERKSPAPSPSLVVSCIPPLPIASGVPEILLMVMLVSADSKALPPVSRTRGEVFAPFRVGGCGQGCGGGDAVASSGIRDPDVESVKRRREAKAASEKSRRILEERRRAQEVLRAQVKIVFENTLPLQYSVCKI